MKTQLIFLLDLVQIYLMTNILIDMAKIHDEGIAFHTIHDCVLKTGSVIPQKYSTNI